MGNGVHIGDQTSASVGTTNFVDNVGVGTTTFGTSADNVISITADGTVPSSSPAGVVQIYADDTSAGATTATLALRTEEAVTTETLTSNATLNVWINGVEYHLLLRTV